MSVEAEVDRFLGHLEQLLGSGPPPSVTAPKAPVAVGVWPSWEGTASERARAVTLDLDNLRDRPYQAHLTVTTVITEARQKILDARTQLAGVRSEWDRDKAAVHVMRGTPEGQGILAKAGALRIEEADAVLRGAVLDFHNSAQRVRNATLDLPFPLDTPGPPPLPTPPAPSTTPDEVTKWWESLSQAQRDALERTRAVELGNLDGVPSIVRERINATRLPGEIARARAAAEAGAIAKPNPAQIQDRQNAGAKLADLLALQKTLSDHPEAGLLLLDTTSNPHTVLAAVAIGDVDHAQKVGVTVGGMNTSVRDSVDGMTREAIAQQDKAVNLREIAKLPNPGAVASIAWLGYETPGSNIDIAGKDLARTGAVSLNHFYHGLAATTEVADQSITAFGHSYGSLTTSLALQQGAPVDNVVLYGSPGAELSNAAQLHVAPGHAYFMDGVHDAVPEVIAELHRFGPPMSEVPGLTELSVNSGLARGGELGDGKWHERAYGHSEYARNGDNGELRMSGYNMAAVLAGLPNDVITPPADLPPPTLPGPFGIPLPVPNPDYHP